MAYLFNGATHVIRRADAVVQTWPLTMFARVRLPTVDTNEHCLVALHEATVNNGFRMILSFTGGTMKARMGTKAAASNANATTTTSVSDTNWHSVIGEVSTSADRQVWLDNGGNGTQSAVRTPGALTKTLIGATEDGGALSTNVGHELADVAIWSGILSADDRAALTAGVSPAFIRPDILEIYWPGLIGAQDQRGGAFTVTGATVVDHPRVYMPAPSIIIAVPAGGATYNETLSESLTAAESLGAVATFATTLSEAATAADSLGGAATFIPTLSESATATDGLSVATTFAASLTESLSAADSVVGGLLLAVTLSESLSASDSVTASLTFSLPLSEGLTASDDVSSSAVFVETITETISAADLYVAVNPATGPRRTVGVHVRDESRPTQGGSARPIQMTFRRPPNNSRGTR